MKTLFRKSIITVIVLSSLFMAAYGATPYIKVKSFEPKKFSLFVTRVNSTPVQISLKDNNDYQFYSERFNSKEGFGKTFDLKSLPDGKYFLEVESKEAIIIHTIAIANGKLTIDPTDQRVINKPYIHQEGNKVDVAMLKANDLPLELSILNDNSDVIYHEKLTSHDNKGKRYDLSHLHPGFYTMSVNVGGKNFWHYIKID